MLLRCPECGNLRLPNTYRLTNPVWLRNLRAIRRERRSRFEAIAARQRDGDYIPPAALIGRSVEEVAAIASLAGYELHVYRSDGKRVEDTLVGAAHDSSSDRYLFGTHTIYARVKNGKVAYCAVD
jgi:hypothetical protein